MIYFKIVGLIKVSNKLINDVNIHSKFQRVEKYTDNNFVF